MTFVAVPSPSRHSFLCSSPHAEPAVQISRNGLPRACMRRAGSDLRMEKFWFGKLKPRATREVAPVHVMALAAPSQRPSPLPPDIVVDAEEFRQAMVQGKVLVETTEDRRQLALLVPSLPVHVPLEPLVGSVQKLPAALRARDADNCGFAVHVRAAYVFEPKRFKRLWFLPVFSLPFAGESPEEQHACLLRRKLQTELSEHHGILLVSERAWRLLSFAVQSPMSAGVASEFARRIQRYGAGGLS